MNLDDERTEAVARMWRDHVSLPFPGRLRSVDVAGVELAMLDADVAGHVSFWLDNRGCLDDRRRNALATRERQLDTVIPELTGEEAAYFRHLLDMAVLVLEA
ncbi:hypothetical protein Aab01nite_11740 [Paractinoplanes abujensis]|uniref:Uncharacterized protein n=1 Tax=Paractinoplanes abujensis TaxID=882441 RepID=A0A7W7CM16_9ACTN|nr:hypothetical protein [Actinoplanes abujensis]MBB4691003.1 hypothetical protein [Actinoplanes abujensis]GID17584.1 hypothetical protein Aab01nite_11740 [Actinoplanes abujensis]